MQQPRLNAGQPIVSKNGTMELPFRKFVGELDRQLPIVGSGSPEGVVQAAYLSLYIDATANAGLITYRKMEAEIAGDRSRGWQLVSVEAAAWGGIGGVLSAQTDLQNALDAAGGSSAWGGITGTLSDQTDLQSALDASAASAVWGSITGTLLDQTDLAAALDSAGDTAVWGSITGTLSAQTDLQAALDAAGGYPPEIVEF